MKFSKHLLILVFLLFYPVITNAEVLWEQNFNAAPEWSSTPSDTQDVNGMTLTHADAISWWNASSYRVPKQKYDVGGTVMMEVKPSADRGAMGRESSIGSIRKTIGRRRALTLHLMILI